MAQGSPWRHPLGGLVGECVKGSILCDELYPAYKEDLGKQLGARSPGVMRQVDNGLRAMLGLARQLRCARIRRGLAHLTLITCTGTFRDGTHDHRLVVYATRIASPPRTPARAVGRERPAVLGLTGFRRRGPS